MQQPFSQPAAYGPTVRRSASNPSEPLPGKRPHSPRFTEPPDLKHEIRLRVKNLCQNAKGPRQDPNAVPHKEPPGQGPVLHPVPIPNPYVLGPGNKKSQPVVNRPPSVPNGAASQKGPTQSPVPLKAPLKKQGRPASSPHPSNPAAKPVSPSPWLRAHSPCRRIDVVVDVEPGEELPRETGMRRAGSHSHLASAPLSPRFLSNSAPADVLRCIFDEQRRHSDVTNPNLLPVPTDHAHLGLPSNDGRVRSRSLSPWGGSGFCRIAVEPEEAVRSVSLEALATSPVTLTTPDDLANSAPGYLLRSLFEAGKRRDVPNPNVLLVPTDRGQSGAPSEGGGRPRARSLSPRPGEPASSRGATGIRLVVSNESLVAPSHQALTPVEVGVFEELFYTKNYLRPVFAPATPEYCCGGAGKLEEDPEWSCPRVHVQKREVLLL